MNTFHGLPAHILLNHLIVVLGPLTAILLVICAVWPAARRRLVWLVLALAVITLIVTPLAIHAGEWLGDRVDETPAADTHMGLGETAIYYTVALAIAAALLAGLHIRLKGATPVKPVVHWLIAAVVIAASVATTYQIYRIGESGARAVWGDLLTSSNAQ
jgi:ABC-type branched-subunit amino acid transport system permease subunit